MNRLAGILLLTLAGAALGAEPSTNRPASWAKPVHIEGVPNLYRVTDGLYRSAQPTAEGLQNLKRVLRSKKVRTFVAAAGDRRRMPELMKPSDVAVRSVGEKASPRP